MGADYALVHLYWNIPLGATLTCIYRPLLTALDVYKICFLITIAVVSTTPWDSYLIRSNVWSYPENAILGPTLFGIPAEEFFFFVIQTYNTSLLYLLLSKATFHPTFLRGESGRPLVRWQWLGAATITAVILLGAWLVNKGGEGFYMGLILVWAGPFTLLLWTLAYQFIILLPMKTTLWPIAIPTLYLWLVDTLALRRGTWVIEQGTKLNWQLWEGLEIEEAVFFLATNTLIVFGLVAFDNALAILNTFPKLFPKNVALPTPWLLVEALLVPMSKYDENRINGLQHAFACLKRKSRSFSIASSVFPGRVRIDLILLYYFCRVADDFVDDTELVSDARTILRKLRVYLDLSYSKKATRTELESHIVTSFPKESHPALLLLPTDYLPSKALYSLLDGFETDLVYRDGGFPMKTDSDLEAYAERVAGTVAEMCVCLVFHHAGVPSTLDQAQVQEIIGSAFRMAVALQIVNIARDIQTDALTMERAYIPTSRLSKTGFGPEGLVEKLKSKKLDKTFIKDVENLRRELLMWAMDIYKETRPDIERLPKCSRGGVRVMVESYVEIGRVMLREKEQGKHWGKGGKATVGRWRRLWVAWRAMVG